MEDYKKLYKQTQRKMKEFIKRWDGIKLSSNDLFTEELKQIVEIENEDERVRKEIIETFKILGDGKIPVDINYADIFTWLENQGESNPYSGISFKYNGHIWGMCARDNGVDILLDKQLFKHLEKQSEQKQYDIDILEKHITKDSISELAHTVIVRNGWEIVDAREQKPYGQRKECEDCQFNYAGECKGSCQMKRDEQKPADKAESMEHGYITTNSEFFQWIYDRLKYVYNENPNVDYMLSLKERIKDMQKFADKVKPMFKVGDWVIRSIKNEKRIGTVTEILPEHYIINFDGWREQIPIIYGDCIDIRLWTIQDAKDGDVLAVNGKPFICYHTDEYKGNYCCIDDKGCFRTNIRFSFEGNCILPATKEQRDLLFQKMKDAGYEWDAQEKELKLLISNGGDFESENCIQKTTKWNKEDEIRLNRICKTLWKNRKGDTDEIYQQEQDIDWLKSLKNRVQPHSQPAWSEEDETNSCQLKTLFENLAKDIKHEFRIISENDRDKYTAWLKSLKDRVIPQPKQEWSEEDEKERKRVIGLLEGWLSTFKETCYAEDCKCGIAWLEKQGQKPQSHWKPNEEQMKVLDEVLNFAANHESPYWNYYIFETLNNLIRHLKKLKGE